jgi:hypothetical protein
MHVTLLELLVLQHPIELILYALDSDRMFVAMAPSLACNVLGSFIFDSHKVPMQGVCCTMALRYQRALN